MTEAAGRRANKVTELGPVERSDTLAEQAYRKLCRALMTGTLTPGEKVTTRGIARALGVSLTPAREAIGRLTAERALAMEPGRAVVVPVLSREQYKELVQIRILLEGLAAEAALKHYDAAGIAELEAIQEAMSAAIERGESKSALALNEDFHFHIYARSNMPTLLSMIEGLWLQVGPTMNLLTPDYQRSYQGVRNHKAAIMAIRKRSAQALRAAIVKDLEDGTRHLERLLES